MKKIYALGVAGLLMMGTASQASAGFFDPGHFTMSIYDTTTNTEKGFDLGALDLTQNHANMLTGLSFTGFGSSNGVNIYANNTVLANNQYQGYYTLTKATSTSGLKTNTSNGSAFNNNDLTVRNTYQGLDSADGHLDGVTSEAANFAASYKSIFGTNSGYGGLNTATTYNAKAPLTAGSSVNMYLYGFHTDTVNGVLVQDGALNGYSFVTANTTYEGKFTLTNDGTHSYTSNLAPVPIPGAVWLLGSGLAGLAGIRRRKNS